MAEQTVPKTADNASLEPPLIKRYTPDTSTKNWKSRQYMPGIATEVESEWMEKLYQKFKEIDTMKTVIQQSINDVDKGHLNAKQELNGSFGSMISLLEERRDTLLRGMSQKVSKYKRDLHSELQEMSTDRKELSQVKKQYESNVSNKELTDIEEREKDNIEMISDALNNTQIKGRLKAKQPVFIIDQTEANKTLNNIGRFILKRETPEAPIVSVLLRTSENALIEVLMNEKYNDDPVLKYELNVYKGPLEEKEWGNVQDDEYLVKYCDIICSDNICFYTMDDLDDNEWYNIRFRCILKDDDVAGNYCKWISFKTRSVGSDDEDEMGGIVPYTDDDEKAMEDAWNRNMEDESLRNREIDHFESWLLIFKSVDLGLKVYEQKRLFYCMQHVENGINHTSNIGAPDFANFILNVAQRFDCKEWNAICKSIRDAILR